MGIFHIYENHALITLIGVKACDHASPMRDAKVSTATTRPGFPVYCLQALWKFDLKDLKMETSKRL